MLCGSQCKGREVKMKMRLRHCLLGLSARLIDSMLLQRERKAGCILHMFCFLFFLESLFPTSVITDILETFTHRGSTLKSCYASFLSLSKINARQLL